MSKGFSVRSYDGLSNWNVERGTLLAELIQRATKRLDTDADTANAACLVLSYSNRLISALLTLYAAGDGDKSKMNTAIQLVQQNLETTCSQVEASVLSR
jgi:hypothetical protein